MSKTYLEIDQLNNYADLDVFVREVSAKLGAVSLVADDILHGEPLNDYGAYQLNQLAEFALEKREQQLADQIWEYLEEIGHQQ